jgi:hypothetical protein
MRRISRTAGERALANTLLIVVENEEKVLKAKDDAGE